jgi:GNAT superfamily N-acetyltransferase
MSHIVFELPYHEYDRYRKHLLALDIDSRYLRFGYHIADETINTLCNTFEENFHRHRVFVIEDDNLDVVGAGHISLEGRPIELAFSVLKSYQGKGMGHSLMSRVVEWCQNRGIKAGCMVCLKHNAAIKKLAARQGILINHGGEILADIQIPDANAASLIHEAVDNGISKLDHLGKLQRKFARMITFPLRFSK